MPRPKPTPEDIEQRKIRSKEWVDWRFDHLYTQSMLAEAIGISRRTVQQIEAANITPHPKTLEKFEKIVASHRKGKVA